LCAKICIDDAFGIDSLCKDLKEFALEQLTRNAANIKASTAADELTMFKNSQ
jgi:hypothetical protein